MFGKIKTLDELNQALTRLNGEIQSIQRACDFQKYSDLSALEVPSNDADGIYLWNELREIMNRLDDVQMRILLVNAPVELSGALYKTPRGRYMIPGQEYELTCGCGVELLIDDGSYDIPYWCAGRIEHNGTDYYFTGCPKMPLEGAQARIRR